MLFAQCQDQILQHLLPSLFLPRDVSIFVRSRHFSSDYIFIRPCQTAKIYEVPLHSLENKYICHLHCAFLRNEIFGDNNILKKAYDFQVSKTLTFKARPRVKSFLRKMSFSLQAEASFPTREKRPLLQLEGKMKLVFLSKSLHLASFWNRDLWLFGNGPS